MSKKNKAKNRRREGGAWRPHVPASVVPHAPQTRRLTPIKVGIGLGVVLLGAAALLSPWLRTRDSGALPGAPVGTTQPGNRAVTPALSSLPPPAPGTRVPLNDVDPLTGKAITANSPTTNYKGYVIGFCCDQSGGYRGDWARMSESQKDAFVRRYLK